MSTKFVTVDQLAIVKDYVDLEDAKKYQTITYDSETLELKFYKNGGTGTPDLTVTLPDISGKLDKFSGTSSDAGKLVAVGSDGEVIAMTNKTLADLATLDDLAAAVNGIFVPASALPTASAETMGKIYLVPNEGTGTNVKDEYVTIRDGVEGSYTYSWELFGTTEIDLSGYVETSFEIAGLDMTADITASALREALNVADGATAAEVDTSDNSITDGTNTISGIWTDDDYDTATDAEVNEIFGFSV